MQTSQHRISPHKVTNARWRNLAVSEMQNVNCPSQEKTALDSFYESIIQNVTFCGVVQFHVYILFGIFCQSDDSSSKILCKFVTPLLLNLNFFLWTGREVRYFVPIQTFLPGKQGNLSVLPVSCQNTNYTDHSILILMLKDDMLNQSP